MCNRCTLGDEKHLIFECPELQCFREQWPHLFQGPRNMLAFMWQDDLISVAKFVNACIRKMSRWKAHRKGCSQTRVEHLISLVWLEEM